MVAVSIWNVVGLNLFPVPDIGSGMKYIFFAVCVYTVYLLGFHGVALFFVAVISVVLLWVIILCGS